MSTPSLRTTTPARTPGPARRQRSMLALSAIVGTQLMLLLDMTVVNVAIPGIGHDLGFSTTGRSWVLNIYILAFGGLLLLGSRIGDLIGRRTALQAGVAAFTLASVMGGLATGPAWLLAARLLQGVSAALAAPSTLALIATTFREGTDRQKALSVFSAVSGAGSSIGLILGGALTEWGSWRWIFFINIPIGAAILLLAPRHIAETDRHAAAAASTSPAPSPARSAPGPWCTGSSGSPSAAGATTGLSAPSPSPCCCWPPS